MKKILVHVCCADCGLKMLKAIGGKMEVLVYYYNPNIHPRAEYLSRLAAVQKMIKEKIVVPDWRPEEYFKKINLKRRCQDCWKLRLEKTAEYAKEKGYEVFSSTLLSSQYQDGERVKRIGEEAGKKFGVEFWAPGVIERELRTAGFYKQFFCGCVYSLEERYREKYEGNR